MGGFWNGFLDGFCVPGYCDIYGLIINGVNWLGFVGWIYVCEIGDFGSAILCWNSRIGAEICIRFHGD